MHTANRHLSKLFITACALVISVSCEREERVWRTETPASDAEVATRLTDLVPGPDEPPPGKSNAYEENAYALQQGQSLYLAFNCIGCHAMGGGGIGPPLMDDQWRYGSRPEQVYSTIVQGRPNGMPAFGQRIGPQQAWQLAAYVRSMSGLVPLDAAPGRMDHMQNSPAPNTVPTSRPVDSLNQVLTPR